MSGGSRLWSTVFAGVAIATASVLWHRAHHAAAALATARHEAEGLRAYAQELKTRLPQEQAQFAAVEADNGRLLARIAERMAAARPAPLTRQSVNERFRTAQVEAQQGDLGKALASYLWCYDEGFLRNAGLLQRLWQLGERDPQARVALRERRDRARAEIGADGENPDALGDFLLLNRTLQETAASLSFYDSLPLGDSRRQALAGRMLETFVEERRYRDALGGLPSYEQMIELMAPPPAIDPAAAAARDAALARVVGSPEALEAALLARRRAAEAQRGERVTRAGVLLEALAGAGEIEQARGLLEKLRDYDSSPPAAALIRQHLERAGQSALLGAGAAP